MHGFTSCRTGDLPWSGALYLDAVLEDCYAFLDAHPGETVLFAVKQEHGDESVEDFQRVLDGYVKANPSYWLKTDSMPTLGEARGKLVLLRRYDDAAGLGKAAGLPLRWADQRGEAGDGLDAELWDQGDYALWVQDRFEYNEKEKWTAFLRGLAHSDSGASEITLSFLSTKGSFAYGHPYRFASNLNHRLANDEGLQLRGWVVLDYGSAPLAERIYSVNFN